MDYQNNILETIGNTPLVKLDKSVDGIPGLVLAKVEYFNPGHSIKDRMALEMVEDAEKKGLLKAGGTIIECTSGNTGMGIALAACIKGYKCIFTMSDKQSTEKINILKSLGAEVIVCPTNVTPEDPRSYYSVAERLSKEIPNSVWMNQYDNLSNTVAHYKTTGPEIWNQTDGKVTHLVVPVGTGGTISGTAKYLKEQNPNIKIWGVDSYGSVFKKYHETGIFDEKEIYPYILEGVGEDILPENVDFDLIDTFEKVTDKDSAVFARRVAREEGILVGYSCGAAIGCIHQLKDQLTDDDVVVVIFHDHGSRYINKIYNDDWMRDRGFLDSELKVQDLVNAKQDKSFFSVSSSDKVKDVLKLMKENDISQLPVIDNEEIKGSITESGLLEHILASPLTNSDNDVSAIIGEKFPVVEMDMKVSEINRFLTKKTPAVLTKDKSGTTHILTQYDILQAL